MTIQASTKINMDVIPMVSKNPPPVNNACMPDIYNKLDAETIERTRVINSLLDVRLSIQEKVLKKYQIAAERRYSREKDKIQNELRKISRRLPNYSDIPHLEAKIIKYKRRKSIGKHDCVFTTEPKGINGIATEKEERPFCDRFFSHHLPTKARWYKDVLPYVKKGISMPDLRPRDRAGIINLEDHLIGGRQPSRLPSLRAMDDSFMASRGYVQDDDETKTV